MRTAEAIRDGLRVGATPVGTMWTTNVLLCVVPVVRIGRNNQVSPVFGQLNLSNVCRIF